MNVNHKQNILIAGVTGYIGSYLYNYFHSSYNIFSIGRGKSNNINYSQINFNSLNQMNNFFKSSIHFDVLILLIGLAHNKGRLNTYDNHLETNFKVIDNILTSATDCKKMPRKIIYASTISVYGENFDVSLFNEDAATFPFSPYAITKRKTEKYLKKKYNNISWILRLGPVYSRDFILNIRRRTSILGIPYKIGGGNKKLSLCNLENIGICINSIIVNKVPAGIYNLTDKKEYKYIDLLKRKNKKHILRIPRFMILSIYFFAKRFNSIFLKENSIKLLTNNIYSSKKVRKYIDLSFSLDDI